MSNTVLVPLKIADLATNRRYVWGGSLGSSPSNVGFGTYDLLNNNDYYQWLPQNPTNAALYSAAPNEYVIQDSRQIDYQSVNRGAALEQEFDLRGASFSNTRYNTLDVLKVTPYPFSILLSADNGKCFNFYKVLNGDTFGLESTSVNTRYFMSIPIPQGREISGKIKIISVVATADDDADTIDYDPRVGVSLFVTSSTALSRADVLIDMDVGTVPGAVTTYQVNKEFTFDSTSTSFFHDFTNTPDTNKNIVLGATCRVAGTPRTDVFFTGYETGMRECIINCSIELYEKVDTSPIIPPNNPPNNPINFTKYSRYEYTTLAAIDALAAVDGHIWDGEASPLSPDPVTGTYKVTLIYSILFPVNVKSYADFNREYEGIFVHPFKPEDTPQVFLEDQSGTTQYTNRIQFTKRNVCSTLFELYDIECTADQFNNWKVAIYFTNKILEATFKTYCDKVGASIWVMNTDDFRE